jgi:hypothetical protein
VKVSELQGLLSKVQSVAGDVEVILKSAETEAQTVISDLAIHLDPSTGQTGGSLEVTHAPAPEPVAESKASPAADAADSAPSEPVS